MNLRKEHRKYSVFPIEILLAIALELHDTRSLACLCRVNTQLNQALCPMLYREVHVTGIQNIHKICESVATSARQLGPLIHRLRLESPLAPCYDYFGNWDRESRHVPALRLDLVPNMRAALCKMSKLTVLSVNFPPDEFDSIFEGLSLPYRLEIFSSQFLPSVDFLRSQPSITTLHLTRPGYRGLHYLLHCHEPTLLPSLRHIEAPDDVILTFLSGWRPVTKVVSLDTAQFMYKRLLKALARSRSDVVSFECPIFVSSRGDSGEYGWEDRVRTLTASSLLRMTLKQLRFRLESDSRQASGYRGFDPLIKNLRLPPGLNLELLSGFTVLERLEFKIVTSEKPPQRQICKWLGYMNSMDAWRNLIPSLEAVIAFGRVIR
ncbi:hypothetical protein FRC12_011619 [Ceratobasidium sp. 428]|nr:hypothetical protein FRC12_011619 [Ceratobasidium sp. 428]